MVDKTDQAKKLALAGYCDPGPKHLNCAQTVLYFCQLVTNQDPDLILLGRNFGGGMVRMGQVCGAVSGAALALGLRDYLVGDRDDRKKAARTFVSLQELMKAFEERFGALTCRSLIAHDIRTEEGFRAAKRVHAMKHCPDLVSWVCDFLTPILETGSEDCPKVTGVLSRLTRQKDTPQCHERKDILEGRVIVADVNDDKLELAAKLGADHLINPNSVDPLRRYAR